MVPKTITSQLRLLVLVWLLLVTTKMNREESAALAAEVQHLDDLLGEMQQLLQRHIIREVPDDGGEILLGMAERFFQRIVDHNIWDDAAADDLVENYVYIGGRAPWNVRKAVIDESLTEIRGGAFRRNLLVTDVEFGNSNLDIVGDNAFEQCRSLRGVTMPSVRIIGEAAFSGCEQLEFAEFGVELEYVGLSAFTGCPSLRRITIPLKDNITFGDNAFKCDNLTTVNLVGADGLQKTVSSLHMERWRNEINQEINRINRTLPDLEDWEKTSEIQEWLERVRRRFNRYKTEHRTILKESMTLLDLALWKTKLDKKEAELEFHPKKAKIDVDSARKELRITSGASVIIKNVFPFLKLA